MNEWYYASGAKQAGPVTLETLIDLAKSGGLDPVRDLVWTATMKDWLPAGQVPGIFRPITTPSAPVVDPGNPYAPPVGFGAEALPFTMGEEMPEIIPGSQPLPPTACIKRAFDLVMRNFGMILIIGIVYVLVASIGNMVFNGIDSALHLPPMNRVQHQNHSSEMNVHLYFGTYQNSRVSFLHMILSNVLSVFLFLGLTRIGLNLVSGKAISVEMLFGGGPKLVTAFIAGILYYLMVLVGLVLLIFPGIYLALRYGQFMAAIVDRNLGAIDALKYSASITTNNKGNLFLLGLLMVLVLIAGVLAIFLGLIVALPVVWLSLAVAYRWMQYGYVAALDLPGTQTPMLSGTP